MNKRARLAALRLDNLINCFNALVKCGVDVSGYKPKDIFDGNPKYITRLVLSLIDKYDPERGPQQARGILEE